MNYYDFLLIKRGFESLEKIIPSSISFQETIFVFWLILGILFLAAEIFIPGTFLFISAAFACVVISAFSFFKFSSLAQFLAGVFSVGLSFLLIKKFVKNNNFSQDLNQTSLTNLDALVGKKALVLKDFQKDALGEVKVGQELWSAKGSGRQSFKKNEVVVVVKVEGNKVLVSKLES